MSIWQAIILGIVQGLTEFLPVSSSGHLVVLPTLLNWERQPLIFDIAVHAATILAIIIYFRNDLKNIINHDLREIKYKRLPKLSLLILITSIPAIFFFLLAGDKITGTWISTKVVATSLLIGGIVMLIIDNIKLKNSFENMYDISFPAAILVGLGQALSLVRGVSRSGAMIVFALIGGLDRQTAVRYAFIAGIPIILGGFILEDIRYLQNPDWQLLPSLLTGFATAFIAGYFALSLIEQLIRRKLLTYMGIYRILLAIVLLVFFV